MLAHTARDGLFVFQAGWREPRFFYRMLPAGIIQKQGEGNAMQKDVNEIFITIRGKKRQIKSISKISPDIIKRAVSPYLDVGQGVSDGLTPVKNGIKPLCSLLLSLWRREPVCLRKRFLRGITEKSVVFSIIRDTEGITT